MSKIIEGVWDCEFCEKTNIKARYKNCPQCNAPQGKNTKFRLPDAISYVPEEEAKTINHNPDWVCNYCGQLNSDNVTTCKGCGSTRNSENKNYFEIHESKTNKTKNFDNNESEYDSEHNINTIDETSTKKQSIKNKENLIVGIVAGLSILAIIATLIWCLMPKTKDITVTNTLWERNIEIEEYKTVDESGWSLPSNARLKYTKSEIQRYDQVIDHYETVVKTKSRQVIDHYETVVTGHKDLGNGYFEEITEQRPVYKTEYYQVTEQEPVYKQIPVYNTKYYYEIDKWLTIDNIKTSGNDKSPYWGEPNLKGKQRIGNKTEIFKIVCIDKDNNTNTYEIAYETWLNINIDDKLRIKINAFDKILEITHIKHQ